MAFNELISTKYLASALQQPVILVNTTIALLLALLTELFIANDCFWQLPTLYPERNIVLPNPVILTRDAPSIVTNDLGGINVHSITLDIDGGDKVIPPQLGTVRISHSPRNEKILSIGSIATGWIGSGEHQKVAAAVYATKVHILSIKFDPTNLNNELKITGIHVNAPAALSLSLVRITLLFILLLPLVNLGSQGLKGNSQSSPCPAQRPVKLYCALFGICALATLLTLYRTHGHIIFLNIFASGNDLFNDYFNEIAYVREFEKSSGTVTPWGVGVWSQYPAFAKAFFEMINLVLPPDSAVLSDQKATSGPAYLSYIIYTTCTLAVMYAAIQSTLKKHLPDGAILVLFLCLLWSFPFSSGLLERGNCVLQVLTALLLFCLWFDSTSPLKRESALLLVAACAAIKIYPAVFGLFLIKQRKFAAAARLTAYGLIFTFAPFIWFGGWQGFEDFLLNISRVTAIKWPHTTVHYLWDLLGVGRDSMPGRLLTAGYFLVLIIAFFKAHHRFQELLVLTLMMVTIPKWSSWYSTAYFLLPWLWMLRSGIPPCHALPLTAVFSAIFSLLMIPYETAWLNHNFDLTDNLNWVISKLAVTVFAAYVVAICLKGLAGIRHQKSGIHASEPETLAMPGDNS